MLYILSRGNHQEVAYRGGQEPILHLVTDVRSVVAWASRNNRLWAFSDRNASAHYAKFYCDLAQLGRVDWAAVDNRDFRDSTVKEGKQAEFLVHECLPWALVERVGTYNEDVAARVRDALQGGTHRPDVEVRPDWYY